jgi:multiple antibiotic resistance protein
MLEHFIEVFSLLIVIIDPPGLLPVFLGLTQNKSLSEQRKIALKSCLVGFTVLITFTLSGDFILDKLGISEPAFRIAGALLMLLTAIDMVMAHHFGVSHPTAAEEAEAHNRPDISVFPLGMPLIAGPGGMASVILLMRKVEGQHWLELNVVAALCLVMVLTYLTLWFATPLSRFLGTTGANVLTRIFGIILAALAIQFIINGINDLMVVPFMKS